MLVLSNQSDLPDCQETDIYSHALWVSDYPFLRRDVFVDVVAAYETMPIAPMTPYVKINVGGTSKRKSRQSCSGTHAGSAARRIAQLLKPY